MAKAYGMEVIKGSNGQLNPNKPITRQEVFVILARAFKLQSAKSMKISFADANDIASWAKGETYAVVNAGYVQGSDGKINPKGLITRAEFAQIFDNMVKEYIREKGAITEVAKGNVMVNVPDVVLENVTIDGDLIIGDGVGDGEVILDTVKVLGRLVVRGGGENSIIIKGGSDISNVVVSRVNGVVSVKVQGDANVEIIYIDDGSDDVNVEGTVGSLEIHAPDVVVTAVGADVKTVNMSGGSSKIVIDKDSKVGTLNVREGAANAKVEVAGVVSGMTTAAPSTAVSGSGTVNKVEVKKGATGAKIETPKTEIVVGVGVEGVTGGGGAKIEGGESVTNDDSGTGINDGPVVLPPTGGGGGSSVPPTPVGVSAITVTGADTVVNGKTLQMGVVIGPDDASNKKVTWSVINGTGSATINSSGLLTATGVGKVTVKALAQDGSGKENTKEITIHADLTAYNAALAAVTEADYTAGSWVIYQSVVTANEVTDTNTQEEVTTATNNIIAAQANLVIPVTGISISGNGSVAKDDTLQLTAIITPDNASNKGVTWSIESGPATISENGLLNPTSEGTVTVKVASQYDTSITSTKEITVEASALDAAKANAKTELDNYVNSSDYTTNATELDTAISDGKTAIDGASDIAGVNTALADAKAAIDAIKSDAQIAAEELATAKDNAKTDLGTYVDADDYTINATALNTAIAEGKTAIDNATDIAGVNTALTDAKTVIDAIKSDKDLDDDDIATAKVNIEGASYTASQAEVSDEASALSKAQALVNALELKETTATVVADTFTGATAGTEGSVNGTDGSFTFTVKINKGSGTEVTTTEQTMIITATPYDSTAQDNADIETAKNNIEAASYTASQAEASDEAKALTKAQALVNALELKGTTANVLAGTFTGAITGTEDSVNGTDGSYTFTVKIIKGLGAEVTTTVQTMTITATSYDPTADNADIATAKAKIESAAYTATQAEVSDASAAKTKVETIISGLETAGTITEVVPGSFSGAVSGVEGVFAKKDGSYSFTVKINKGGGTEAITKELKLTITATETTPVSKASKVTVNNKTLDSGKPYLVGGEPAASGTLGSGDCTAHFNHETGVLTLQGYSGGSISTIFETTPDLIIKLIGSNVITTSYVNGIYNGYSGNIYITSDSDATLEVNSSSNNSDVYAIATHDSSGKSIIIGGEAKVTVTAKTTSPSRKSSVVTAGKDIIIQDDASLTGTSESIATGGYAIYANGKIVIDTTGNVDIDCSASSGSYAFNGMSGVDIENVKLMTLKISEGGNYMSGTVDLSRVAVHKNDTDNIATYRGGVPYNLTLSNGQITAVKDLAIGTEIQYEYQGLENDEITIKAKEISNFAFVKWTNQDGTDLDSSLFVSSTDENSEATIKMPANNLNIKAQYKSTLFTTQPVFHRGAAKVTWEISPAADYGSLQKKNEETWSDWKSVVSAIGAGIREVSNNSGNTTGYAPDGTYRLKLTISSAPVGFRDHYSEEFEILWNAQLVGTVTISGTPKSGETLTAHVTGTQPDAGDLKYQWFAEEAKILGATEKTLVLGEDQVGKQIKVKVSSHNYNMPIESAATVAVDPIVASISNVVATNGTVTITLDKKPSVAPIATDFTATSNINAAGANALALTGFNYDGDVTVTYTFTPVVKTDVVQNVVVAVTYNLFEKVAPAFEVEANVGVTETPVITGPVRGGDTSVSGTAVDGATVVLSVNASAKPGVIATGGNWTVSELTLVENDVIKVTAILAPNTISSEATTTVTAAPDFALGSGTELDPYQVSSAKELNKVRNHLEKHFIQTADINLSTYTADGGWQPIGDSSTPFKGTYDGNSMTITGLVINRPEADYQGLFGSTASAKVENCRISGSVTGKNYVGGLVGSNDGGTISSCYAPNVSITGKDSVGGLVGFVKSSSGALATIEKSYASGSVKGVINVGGLVGLHSMQGNIIGGSIKNSYTDVLVDATGSYVGGLIGNNKADYRYEETSIENCYSKGSVKSSLEGKVYIGGLVGGSNHNIKNSYAVGEVIVTNGEVGYIGGLIGRLMGSAKVTSSYYDIETTNQPVVSGNPTGIGKTTAEMKQAATFVGWDFETIWNITDDSYPTLKWQE